ncbi:hypothetical protein B0H14DRAFT_3893972 [Mycena olivaceomarginata]|nr:hypothetical protein B0H14DRAFT_3893972 [Mycena olivaceomarginata]
MDRIGFRREHSVKMGYRCHRTIDGPKLSNLGEAAFSLSVLVTLGAGSGGCYLEPYSLSIRSLEANSQYLGLVLRCDRKGFSGRSPLNLQPIGIFRDIGFK